MKGETRVARASAVVLAGGQSRRMGQDKAFIDFEGEPLIARVLARVRPLCTETIIVANQAEAFAGLGARVVADVYPGKGSLGGIFSGLRAAREAFIVAVACDMPFLNQDLIRYQLSLAPEYDVVIPRAQDPSGRVRRPKRTVNLLAKDVNLHPMHAIYSRNCESAIQERLDMDDLRVISFLESVRVHVVEPEQVDRFDPRHWSFFNVNTPEDLEAARRLQSTEEGSRADAQA